MKKINDEDWPTTEQIKKAMPGYKVPTGAITMADGSVHHMQWILNEEGVPVPEDDNLLWMKWMEEHDDERTVAADRDEGYVGKPEDAIHVSTVFLGRNLNYGGFFGDKPIVYETMIFNGELANHQMRYATREEALAGHQIICNAVMQTLPKRGDGA